LRCNGGGFSDPVGALSGVLEGAGFNARASDVISWFTQTGSPLKASMLRATERGSTTEGEHELGDMVVRACALGIATPLLDLARIHVAAYESSRARESARS
jgi:2-dehydropantoate 2-reductase